jgi:hypothetical protein
LTTYYWISTIASTWNSAANWSLTSGGSGGAGVPSAGDTAIFDANGSGDCSLDANLGGGTLLGGTYTPLTGIALIQDSGYTGTLNFTGYDVDASEGIVGFDGNLTWGAGRIAVSGTLDVRDFGTSGNLIFYGSLTYYGGPYTQRLSTCVVASSSIVLNKRQSDYASAYYGLVADDLDIYGRIEQDDDAYSILYSSGSGDINIRENGSLTIGSGVAVSYTVTASGIPVRCNGMIEGKLNVYKSATVGGDWTSASSVQMGASSTGDIIIGADAILPDTFLRSPTASSYSYVFTDGVQCVGEVTAIDGGGSIAVSGELTLTGTTDQTIDLGAADTSGLNLNASKTAGEVRLLSADLAIGDDGFLSGTIVNAANLTLNGDLFAESIRLTGTLGIDGQGIVRAVGPLTFGGGTIACDVDAYCNGLTVEADGALQGEGTIYHGEAGAAITGTATITSVDASTPNGIRFFIADNAEGEY